MTNVKPSAEHKSKVRQQLINNGVTRYGLMKMEARHLAEVIHPDENIEGIAYGLSDGDSAMLVATDRRVIYFDRKPFYTITDELTYEMVAGVALNIAGKRAAVTLHTRLGDFIVKFVNTKAAEKFVHYIEIRRIEEIKELEKDRSLKIKTKSQTPINEEINPSIFSEESVKFLHSHQVAVLSTIARDSKPRGTVIYYFADANNNLYMLTKSETDKVHNILANPLVALTIFDAKKAQTLQISAKSEIEANPGVHDFVFRQLSKPRKYATKVDLPPVDKLNKGGFIVFRFTPTSAVYNDYGKE
jgi:uncharacterized pyridoxamine 5'-phosphate oxidase family protein